VILGYDDVHGAAGHHPLRAAGGADTQLPL